MIDYESILKAVNAEIRKETNCIPKEQEAASKQPKYPFFTYSIISPYLNAKVFREGNVQIEEVEIVISFTFYSLKSFEVMSLAQRSATMLKSTATRQILYDKGVTVVRIDDLNKRDNFISIQTERRAGFDLRIRIRHSETKSFDHIETITIGG
ncbi:phage neck terminator protein [Peribacillus muralis]|uniref:phage neck terminator protein n=1 Tax=Peribacillus muralis TaxID=264697 RepID=UPI003D082598